MLDTLRDFRIAVRSLSRTPVFALAAVLSLALGIGLVTVIFSVTNAVLLRRLPAERPDELLRIGQTVDNEGFSVVSYPDYLDIAALDAFTGITAFHPNTALLNQGGEPVEVAMELVSGNYFDVLGLKMARGRGFSAVEDRTPGTHPVAVLSWHLWHERFSSDEGVLGRTVRVNGRPFEIIGVAPDGFRGAFPGFLADIWLPVMMQSQALPGAGSLANRDDRFLQLIGRLEPQTTAAEATTRLAIVAARMANEYPSSHTGRGLATAPATGVHPAMAGVVGPFLALLMVIVGLVLLIATANVANILTARTAARRYETSVRLALGAGRARLVRDHVLEASALCIPGAVLGVFVAFWSRSLMTLVRPPAGLPTGFGLHVPLDLRVLGFALAVALLLGAGLGVASAVRAWRTSATVANPAGDRGGRGLMARLLVSTQVGVSCVLLVGTGLLLRTLANSNALDAGFDAGGMVVASADATPLGYTPERVAVLWQDMRQRALELPQTEAAVLALFVPLGSRSDQMQIADADPPGGETVRRSVNYNMVSPGYFDMLGISRLRGRGFSPRDDAGGSQVAVINRTLAEQLWPESAAIGRRLSVVAAGEQDRTVEIVGVVADIKYRRLSEPPMPFLYLPDAQWNRADMVLHVRPAAGAVDVSATLAEALRAIDPELPLSVRPLREEMAYSLAVPRIIALVVGVSGGVGLFLAAIGVLGMVSHATALRIPEIGIRVALGARAADVRRLVIRQGLRPTIWGLAFGLAAATIVARSLAALLYGVRPLDPLTLLLVAGLLVAVAILASYLPARRATRVDPAISLRS